MDTDSDCLKKAGALLFSEDPEDYYTGAFIKIGFFQNNADLLYQDEVRGNLFKQVDDTVDLIRLKYMKALIRYEGLQRIDEYPVAYTQGSGLWVVFNYSDAYVNKLSAIDRGEKIWFDPENGMGSGTVNGSLNGTVKAVVSQNVSLNEDIASQNETINGTNETINETINGTNETINETINGTRETVNETCLQILAFVARNNNVTSIDLLQHIAVSRATLFRAINFLSSANVHLLKREGARKTGHYALTEDGELFYEKVIKR